LIWNREIYGFGVIKYLPIYKVVLDGQMPIVISSGGKHFS